MFIVVIFVLLDLSMIRSIDWKMIKIIEKIIQMHNWINIRFCKFSLIDSFFNGWYPDCEFAWKNRIDEKTPWFVEFPFVLKILELVFNPAVVAEGREEETDVGGAASFSSSFERVFN